MTSLRARCALRPAHAMHYYTGSSNVPYARATYPPDGDSARQRLTDNHKTSRNLRVSVVPSLLRFVGNDGL